MKLRSLALATVLLLSGGLAMADNITTSVPLGGASPPTLSGGFTVLHLENGQFSDVFTFAPSAGTFLVGASLVTMKIDIASDITFTSAYVNTAATPLTLSGPGTFEWGSLNGTTLTGPFTMYVNGYAGGVSGATTGPASAQYSGTFSITPVPEPETYGMLLAGLGIVGFLASRRKSS